ncbi:unnamed protein product [Closterium sp. NIES-54]
MLHSKKRFKRNDRASCSASSGPPPHSNMQNNLLSYRIDSFTTNLRSLPVLADIRLHYNYLWGEIPSYLVGLPKLTNLVAYYNYFIGTVPALGPLLLSLDVRGNFLTDLPSASYTWCGCAGNCMAAATAAAKCISGGPGQRPTGDCAVCGTTNGVAPLCAMGGVCKVDASARVTAGTVNLPAQPALPMTCSLLMDPVDCACSSPCSSPCSPPCSSPCSSPCSPGSSSTVPSSPS